MALLKSKNPENVPGKYYVDDDCIDCNLCSEISPKHFSAHIEGGYHIVKAQPFKISEIELLSEAIASCPTAAIGDDGDTIQ
ncbi:MAG: ferredoxin [Proteobacteria bacterium]|nr:ferredoxin [Pseudomonadota bacterium]